MASIGGGYVWPNITVFSDGERVAIDARPTERRPSEPLRYIQEFTAVVEAAEFESAVDSFVQLVISKLLSDKIVDTNLEKIWHDLSFERQDKDSTKRRRFEALLGYDPDEADPKVIDQLMQESLRLGEGAVRELAADARGTKPPSEVELIEWATTRGISRDPRNNVRLVDRGEDALPTKVAAWRRGASAARALRKQEGLGDKPVSTRRLCEMVGTSVNVMDNLADVVPFSFELDENVAHGRIAMRSHYETGRRFDIARLLGDRLAAGSIGKFAPATRAYTYRQKMQRSFAAEFLSPFTALDDMLSGDFSDEAIESAAHHFNVSPLSVRTSLANHGRIEREDVAAIS